MPKKIKFESFKYRFLISAKRQSSQFSGDDMPTWNDFINQVDFVYKNVEVTISWKIARPGSLLISLNESKFFIRGDNPQHRESQQKLGHGSREDPVKLGNEHYFNEIVQRVAQMAGYNNDKETKIMEEERIAIEREFHDSWASSENIENIDVRLANEACTAPEMRYIVKRLGDIRGKRLLDVGCGLGEASVYFALLGAVVTSTDLSQGMLDATCNLAKAYNVNVTPHVSAAEDLCLPSGTQFDVIYAGNLMHHVDIGQTLARIKPHLAPGGVLVTWDPLAYNPFINAYRRIATSVRTPDEHPLKFSDIKLFRSRFDEVETRYFWLCTLIIFVFMALVQRRNPNKERFWKVVVQEGEQWRWLYTPLEKLDRLLLAIFPPLRLLCWNVVVVASNK